MDTHVRVIGWLWIVMGVLGILAAICAVTIILGFGQVPNPQDANIATAAILCVLIPVGYSRPYNMVLASQVQSLGSYPVDCVWNFEPVQFPSRYSNRCLYTGDHVQ